MIYPGGRTVAYTYDTMNRMSSVTDWLGRRTSYTYDADGNLKQSANPNRTTAAYTYDTADRLTALTNAKSDASVIATYAFTLDPVGNHSQVNQTEPLSPSVTAQAVNYAYDADNRLTTVGTTSPTYDANGNLKTRGSDTFGYDFDNRLVQSTIGGVASTYLYDGLGNRKSLTSTGTTKRFVLDTNGSLSHVLAETDASGKVTAYYIHGRGLVSRLAANGTPLYYHFDVRGSTIALSNEAGQLTDQYAYEPFGKLANSQGATANPFKYVGKYGVVDEGNGISYIRARYYSPELGRFISKDPLTGTDGDSQSLHRYVYAVNNPIRLIDVSGFCSLPTQRINGSSDDSLLHKYLVSDFGDRIVSLSEFITDVADKTKLLDTLKASKNQKMIASVAGYVSNFASITSSVMHEVGGLNGLVDSIRNSPSNVQWFFNGATSSDRANVAMLAVTKTDAIAANTVMTLSEGASIASSALGVATGIDTTVTGDGVQKSIDASLNGYLNGIKSVGNAIGTELYNMFPSWF